MAREGRLCGRGGARHYEARASGEARMARAAHENLEERLLHRMLFFSDAVFAIVMTLLVLELKPPEGLGEANAETLRHALPHIEAFAFSFLIIAVFWTAHLNITRNLARFDW